MIIIHHSPCIDGFTAAWIAHKKYGNAAQYVPAKYGDAPPKVRGHHVLVLDFSYPRDELEQIAAEADSLLVLDHHKTAEEDLRGLPYAQFDMKRSGAGMACDHFFPNMRGAYPLVSYVEDRDLWRFALHGSKEINAVIGANEQTWDNWNALDDMILHHCNTVRSAGYYLLKGVEQYVSQMRKQAIERRVGGHIVPVVNAPYINTSELVGALAEDRPFAIGWYQRGDGKYAYSLRSRGDFDVSALAKEYGGGGHKQAAGFQSDDPPDLLWGL
jgi:oligoribonuclease NrnB/cAMP/cGMP phosphodiesterase (DHH superfamily)